MPNSKAAAAYLPMSKKFMYYTLKQMANTNAIVKDQINTITSQFSNFDALPQYYRNYSDLLHIKIMALLFKLPRKEKSGMNDQRIFSGLILTNLYQSNVVYHLKTSQMII